MKVCSITEDKLEVGHCVLKAFVSGQTNPNSYNYKDEKNLH